MKYINNCTSEPLTKLKNLLTIHKIENALKTLDNVYRVPNLVMK